MKAERAAIALAALVALAALALAPLASSLPPSATPRALVEDADAAASLRPGRPQAGIPIPPQEEDDGFRYRLRFDCTENNPVREIQSPCPTRIESPEHVFGNPSLAVNPRNPQQIAIAALGGVLADGPSPASRGGTPHVLLTSEDGGKTFTITPVPSPEAGLLGEEVALVSNAAGDLVLAALYSRPGEGAFSYVLATWQLGAFPGTSGLGSAPTIIEPWAQGARLTRIALAHDATSGAFILSWQEDGLAADPRQGIGPANYVRLAWLRGGSWTALAGERVVGPCGQSSNVVARDGEAYLACAAGQGLLEAQKVGPGDVVLHALDLETGDVAFRSRFPYSGSPALAITPSGRVALAVLEVQSPEKVRILLSTGEEGRNWTSPRDVGNDLRPHNSTAMASASIAAMAYQASSETVHFVIQELPVRAESGPTGMTHPRLTKWLAAASAQGEFLFRTNLDVDNATERFLREPGLDAFNASMPADPRDALAVWKTREFIAYSDAGAIVFGELAETPLQIPAGAPVQPSSFETGITKQPARPFTPQFLFLGGALAAGLVARILIGRISITGRIKDGDE